MDAGHEGQGTVDLSCDLNNNNTVDQLRRTGFVDRMTLNNSPAETSRQMAPKRVHHMESKGDRVTRLERVTKALGKERVYMRKNVRSR